MCTTGQEAAGLQGTQEWVAWALLAEKLPLMLCNPVLLAAHIWGRNHFEEFKIFSLGRSLQSSLTLVPKHVSVPSAPERASQPTGP